MSTRGMRWQKLELPLAAGLNQKADDRARPQPFLDICRDVQFDELGGIQTRYPFAEPAGDIFGGGTIANARRIERFGSEVVLFTDTELYSWNAQLSKWFLRGAHLAVALTERPAFATTGDQVDGDRAELNGTIVYAWTEGGQVYAAALDKTTGAVSVSPTALSQAVGLPRLVALDTRILLFVAAGSGGMRVRAIDPAAPGTAIAGAGALVASSGFGSASYDVVRAGTQDLVVGAFQRSPTTSYEVFRVTPALAVTTTTKARTCDGPIAVSTIPDGTVLQIVRANGTNIQGDRLTTSTLADVATAQAIGTAAGTPVNQIAACHRSVQNGGAFRCYVFWSAKENPAIHLLSSIFETKTNFVDSAGTIGTQSVFALGLAPGSRAFDHNGSVYLWMTFGQDSVFQGHVFVPNAVQAQNAYVLYRDDGFIAAKAAFNVGAGLRSSTGLLPGVSRTAGSTTYSWIATSRRRAKIGTGTGYAARGLLDVTFEFDSNRARRCAQLGSTLYIAGGEVLQYDGTRLTEVGFHFYPWAFAMLISGVGDIEDGEYQVKVTWRWQNARNETERSTTATIGTATMAAGPAGLALGGLAPLVATHKTMTAGGVAAEVWRSLVNQDRDAPLFLASSSDPNNATNPNRYIPNDLTAGSLPVGGFLDALSDVDLAEREQNPENGAVLENLAPPAASIIFATDTRLFLLDVAGDPDRGWYSKLRGAGEVAAFHDTLTFDVPRGGGSITSGWFDANGVLYVARQTAIYAFGGSGRDNLGEGQNYTFVRTISDDIGVVNHESVALTPRGIIFKSLKGWQLLKPSGDVDYIGDKVSDFDDEAVLAVHVVETQHHVRILTAARLIVWDYLANQWGEHTVDDGVHACVFGGAYVYLAATGSRTQLTTYTGLTYGWDVETAWLKVAELQGAAVVRKLQPLGEVRSAALLRVRIAYNYNEAYVDDKIWAPSPSAAGSPLQVAIGPKRPKCESIKLRLTAVAAGESARMVVLDDLAPDLSTDAGPGSWNAILTAAAAGEAGNVVTISIGFEPGELGISVRDHFRWEHATQTWAAAPNNVGILVTLDPDNALTIEALEEAIDSESALCAVTTHDAVPAGIDVPVMLAQQEVVGSFSGGTYVAPTGEAFKLTALGLEVGIEPGLFRRLPAAQKV